MNYPYDISYFKHQTNPSEDKIWCSEADYQSPGLVCLNNNGQVLHKIKGIRYENNPGQYYFLYFEPHMQPRISVYSDVVGMLAFTFANENNNSIVGFMLNENGEPASMFNDTVVYAVREHIDFNYKLTSVQIHKPSIRSYLYPYMWVTSGGYAPPYAQTENMVHLFAINKFASFAYLGSTRMPRNTYRPFVGLLNLSLNDNYMDILTVEEWNWYYGVRRYWPFADIHSDYVTNYCSGGRDEMQWKAVFTNECNIRLRVERKPQNSTEWEPVKIRSVDGITPGPNTPYYIDIPRGKGWTAWTGEDPVDIQLKLPIEDYVIPGTQLRLRVKIFPEYLLPDDNNPNYVSPSDYIVGIDNQCLPIAGGCPYIYVKNTDDEFIADNNILNKSEFSSNVGDITDKYKLNVSPGITDNQLKIALVENETDHSYFDQIKFYAVDYNENYKFNITGSNDFILYNPSEVISTDYATLNNKTVITNLIQYTNPSIVTGYINDVIYAHYPAPQPGKGNDLNNSRSFFKKGIVDNTAINSITDSIAIIALLDNIKPPNPVIQKNWAAELTATMFSGATKTNSFSRRENFSEVIMPVFPYEPSSEDYLDHINVNWTSDFRLRYLAVVPVLYNEPITISELPIDAAIHSITGDVKPQLLEKDFNYAELQSQELINLVFNASSLPILPSGSKRDFVFEVNGRYVTSLAENRLSKKENIIPLKNELHQNYPNPFNPKTNIKYSISKDSKVMILIYDVLGREVMTLENDFKKAGSYEVIFDGENFSSGVYFFKIQAGDFTDSKKMLILK